MIIIISLLFLGFYIAYLIYNNYEVFIELMLSTKNIFKFLILVQILILFSVYYIEYVMNIYACKLCKYQRLPFFFNIAFLFF